MPRSASAYGSSMQVTGTLCQEAARAYYERGLSYYRTTDGNRNIIRQTGIIRKYLGFFYYLFFSYYFFFLTDIYFHLKNLPCKLNLSEIFCNNVFR